MTRTPSSTTLALRNQLLAILHDAAHALNALLDAVQDA
jgi:hypothetical protein